jgi:hypothetical protein
LFGGGTEDAVIESGNQPSDSVLEQGDTGADTGGGSSAGTGKADDQRLGDGQPPAADVGTGEGIQPSTLDTPIATFTTEKGSTYELFPDATTTRNRAPRDDNEVSGPQPRSSKTIFMSTKAVNDWGPLFQNTEVPVQLVPLADNKAKLVHLKNYGPKKAGDDASGIFDFTTTPKMGLHPVEIADSTNSDRRNIHFGNKIVSLDAAADGTEITTALLDTWGVPKLAPAYKAVENREEDTIIRAELRKLVNNEYFKGNKEAIRNFLDEEPTLFDLAAADAAQEGSDPTASLMQAPTPKAPELGQTGLDFNAPARVETKGQPFLPLSQTQGGTEQRLLPVQTIGTGYYAQTEDGQDESIGGTELLPVESLADFNERIKRDKLEPAGVVAPFKPSAGTGRDAAPGGPTRVDATFAPVPRGRGREVPVDVQKLVKRGKVTPAQYDAIEANMERQANAEQTAKLRELWDKQWPMPTAAELEVAIGKFLDANPDRREAYSTVNLANYKPNDLLDHPRLALEFFIAENDRTEVDPTTSKDKKRIVNLLDPRQGDVAKGQSKEDRTEARHAKTYFGKYARPVDAFWHIAADVKAKRTGYRDAKNKEQSDLDKADERELQTLGLSDKLSAAESVFFKGTSQSNAEAAMRWVNKNLSPEAQFEIKKFLNLEGGGERRLKNRRIIDIAKGAAGQDRARVTEDQRNQLQEQIAAEGLLQNALSNTLAIRLALQAVYSKEEIDYLRYGQTKTPRKGKEDNFDYVLRDFQKRTGIDPEKLTDNEVIGVYDDYIFQNLTYPRQRLEELGAA